jgi:hypothetical protein
MDLAIPSTLGVLFGALKISGLGSASRVTPEMGNDFEQDRM